MAGTVHGAGTAFEHTHGPSSAKIVGLGVVTVGGATFMIDRDGQVEAGATTEFGIEHIGGAAVVPSGAWIANPDGMKLSDPVKGEGHEPVPGEDPHWHFNVLPLDPVKKAKFVLQVGEEEAVVDFAPGATPFHHGILNVFKGVGFLELTLHGDAGDLELRLYKTAGERTAWNATGGKPTPYDVPAQSVIRVNFQKHKKTVELRARDLDANKDEDGTPNMRSGATTNYFIFPGESGQDPEWLKGLEWRDAVTAVFEDAAGTSYECDPFVLVPHEVL
ncbi:hypothetical protein CYMTET_6049 [Cymbomonas tetramitiformis]|uniref:Uncharacterized protein n=1 Tax=Cymbomonas tetramitiformis TaxID=36881 RepID=A0AAE0LIG8_9CHLO|nr:hypothetical protein CYMTET_6049 [Cymbomonas tetramitiformis]|eukprot:gene13527-15992_t